MRGKVGTQLRVEAQDGGVSDYCMVGVIVQKPGALRGTANTHAKIYGWGDLLLYIYLLLLLNVRQDLSVSRLG